MPFLKKSSEPLNETNESSKNRQTKESSGFVKKGSILDAKYLKRGDKIVIIPFKAGVDVTANDELGRIALMIVKGIADSFHNHGDVFNVLTDENAEGADLIIKGHVTGIQGPSKIRRWVLLKGRKSLSVEGEMVEKQTWKTVAVFSDQILGKNDTYNDLGYKIGMNVGEFISSETE
ncbi:MAG: hypothetical protein JW847_03320 [Candidatus Omnitrophica bacterium]|nr:hypothetical protein [Candidatus Omnitrophota bacterium]